MFGIATASCGTRLQAKRLKEPKEPFEDASTSCLTKSEADLMGGAQATFF
jgi:hypothetical protein